MNFEEAKVILTEAIRSELRDHAFGDREVLWVNRSDDNPIAFGYCGHVSEVTFYDDVQTTFNGSEADELMSLGELGDTERNDSTGPDQYEDGKVIPSLTTEGVLKELTGS